MGTTPPADPSSGRVGAGSGEGRRRDTGSTLSVVATVLVLATGPVLLADGLVWDEPVDQVAVPWLSVGMYGVIVGLAVLLSVLFVHLQRRDGGPLDRLTVALIALVLLAAPCFAALFAGTLLLRLSAYVGPDAVIGASSSDLLVQDVFRQLAWHGINVIPVVDVPQTMGWSRPVPEPAWPMGVAALAIQLVIVLVVVWAVRELWTSRSRRVGQAPAQPDADPS